MHEDGESMLARGLFGRQLNERLPEHGLIAGLIGEAVLDPDTLSARRVDELRAIAARVESEEAQFANFITSLTDCETAGHRASFRELLASDDGLRLIARTRVQTLASRLGLQLDASDLERHVDLVVSEFPVAIYFVRDFAVDTLNSQMSVTKGNLNATWDLKIAFHASSGGAVGGVPILLVSDDPRLRRAAVSAAQPHRVATRQEYQRLLEDSEALATRVGLLRSPTRCPSGCSLALSLGRQSRCPRQQGEASEKTCVACDLDQHGADPRTGVLVGPLSIITPINLQWPD
jgi:hypothetical protein